MATQPIYQFYSELCGYTPKIWRRFQVAGNITLARLGYIVMTQYEMQARDLFSFEYSLADHLPLSRKDTKGRHSAVLDLLPPSDRVIRFEVPPGDSFPGLMGKQSYDATLMTLRRFTARPGTMLTMQYDHGDGWKITLRLEAVLWDEALPGKLLPRVLEGEGYGIIEDCGGPAGLAQLAEAFRCKTGPEYQKFSKRPGFRKMDLSAFDLEDINFRLKKVPRIYRDLYEYDYAPSEQSLKLLDRKYLLNK